MPLGWDVISAWGWPHFVSDGLLVHRLVSTGSARLAVEEAYVRLGMVQNRGSARDTADLSALVLRTRRRQIFRALRTGVVRLALVMDAYLAAIS